MHSYKRTGLATLLVLLMIVPTVLVILPSYVGGVTVNASSPASGAVLTGSYTFYCNTSNDATGVSLYIDGVLTGTMTNGGLFQYAYTIDTSGYSDGSHIIRYDATGTAAPNSLTMSIPCKFDNSGPSITNGSTFYPKGQTNAKPGDKVTVRAQVSESVSHVASVVCDASKVGASASETMYDDGLHNDGSPDDGFYGTNALSVNVSGGYWATYVLATDSHGNLRNKTVGVNVDQYEPTILEIQTQIPAGQSAVKNGDLIRITGKALDYKIIIQNVVTRQPLDVVLVLDNSGSMRSSNGSGGWRWDDLEYAATTFIDKLTNQDRVAVVSFNAQNSPYESAKLYSGFMYMGDTYTDPNDASYTDTGCNVSKTIITKDDGNHLTRRIWGSLYGPGCWTPIWDSIGMATQYALNNRRTDAVPLIIAMTDGDDYGSSGRETGSETYCPGAPNGATGQTWAISGGNMWGTSPKAYGNVQRETDNSLPLATTTVTPGATASERTRTGLINATIPIFTIGLGIDPQASNSSVTSSYLASSSWTYPYTTEFDLLNIANTSMGGKYYYAPSSQDLVSIYNNVSEIIQKFGVSTLGLEQPNGIGAVQADLSSIGISLMVNMFDDGAHGDGKANDDIYGSDWVSVNSLSSGEIVFDVKGTDLAGNINGTQYNILLDNIQPSSKWTNTSYPPGRTRAQDGYSIYITANCSDTETGLGHVYLDATNIGGGSQVVMTDDGTGNDEIAHDGIYSSVNVTIATGMATGVFTYTVNAYDHAGNIGSMSGNVELFNDVDIIYQNVINEQTISGSFDLRVDITDPDGIPDTSTNPRYRIDANAWHPMSLLSGSIFNGTIYTTGYLDGSHTLYVNAKDSYGAESTESITIVIDNTAPTQCTIISPIANQFIEGVYSFKVTAMDALSIGNVTLTLYDRDTLVDAVTNGSMGYNSGTGYYEFVLGSATLQDGNYSAKAFVRDRAGHELASAELRFRIDNTDPDMNILSPVSSQIINATWSIIVSAVDVFLDRVEYNVDSSGWLLLSAHMTLDTTAFMDGGHSIRFRASDLAGHVVTETIPVTIDNNAPLATFASPSTGQFISGIHSFRVTASDAVGVQRVNLSIYDNDTMSLVSTPEAAYNSGTGYYEYLLDTTTWTDGNYSVVAYVYDVSGYTTQTAFTDFHVDNNAPVLTLNSPGDGAILWGDVPMSLSVGWDPFLSAVEYNVDSSGWVDAAVNWNTTGTADGSHHISFRASDLAGHTTSLSISVRVDNHSPLGSIVSPGLDEFVEGYYTFKVATSDAVGIASVSMTVFNTTYNATFNTQSSTYDLQLDTRLFGDGNYNISALITDLAGWTLALSSRNFSVDNHAPQVSVNSPAGNSFVSGSVVFDVNVVDVFPDLTEYNVDSSGWVNISTPWNTSQVTEGTHDILVRASDLAGHVTTSGVSVRVDNIAPLGDLVSPGTDQYVAALYTFSVLASDQVGIGSVSIIAFGESFNATYDTSSSTYDVTVDTTRYEDGTFFLLATITDLSGRSINIGPRQFMVDNHAPVLSINHPVEGQFVSGTVDINVTVLDTFPGLTEYNVDSSGWVEISTPWNTTSMKEGAHTIRIRTTDLSSRTTSYEITVMVDNIAPGVEIHSPAPHQYVEGESVFKIKATDLVGIDHVLIYYQDDIYNATFNSQSGYYEYTIDTTLQLEDGEVSVSVKAFDLSGKSSADGPLSFYIDNQPPVLTINHPSNGDFVGGVVFINATSADEFEIPTEYNVDGSGWKQVGIGWDTTRVPDGDHTISIRARDIIGHETIETLKVIVDNSAPTCSIHSPVDGQYLEGVITIKVQATDPLRVDRVELEVFGKTVNATFNTVTNYYELSYSTSRILDSSYTLYATAYDISGKSTRVGPVSFYVDSHDPVLDVLSPSADDYLFGMLEFNESTISVIDAFECTVDYNVDDGGYVDISSPLFTSNYRDGAHRISFRASDLAGHQTYRLVNVLFDNSPPEISMVAPMLNETVSGITIIKAYCTDSVELDRVLLTVDSDFPIEVFLNPSTGLYEHPWDTSLLDGHHTVTFTAYDHVGQSKAATLGVVVDNSGPGITPTVPLKGNGQIRFEANVDDQAQIQAVYISIDGEGYHQMTLKNGTYVYLWSTSLSDNGQHIYEIKAVDRYGNEEKATGNIIVDNKKESDVGGIYTSYVIPSFLLVLIVLVILVIAFFIFLFIWTGKAREMIVKDQQQPESPPPVGPEAGVEDDDEELSEIFGTGDEASGEASGENDIEDIPDADWEDDEALDNGMERPEESAEEAPEWEDDESDVPSGELKEDTKTDDATGKPKKKDPKKKDSKKKDPKKKDPKKKDLKKKDSKKKDLKKKDSKKKDPKKKDPKKARSGKKKIHDESDELMD